MKKIKSIKQLKAEKKRIKLRQEELEHKIRSDWAELKEAIRPASVVKEGYSKFLAKKLATDYNGEENIFKSTLNYGISLLAKKFSEKAEEKLGKYFNNRKGRDK